ncbi:MAG: hypothetical protein SGJ27_13715 [Candidatus Melainabacteria bacterium]|nr:hypothetical protein [Candidatus Melainabacteria bacterium]
MSNRVEFSPEIVRLAQARASESGSNLSDELARITVEEVIMNADPELNLLMEPDCALSSIDSVVAAIGANDVVVNSRHIDVRALDDEGYVSLSKALVGTPVLTAGTLVVSLDGSLSGEVVSHIKAGTWLNSEGRFGDDEAVRIQAERTSGFDAVATISGIVQGALNASDKSANRTPEVSELHQFLKEPSSFITARQKQLVTALCTSSEVRDMAREVHVELSRGAVNRMLRAEANWNRRTEEMVDKLSPKFKSLTRDELKKHVTITGEELGGQFEAPAFRKALLKRVSSDELSRRLGGNAATKMKNLYDQIIAGKSPSDAVKQVVKNQVAVDIAQSIKSQRGRVENFVAVTAEEIGRAFQQLALQPSYATHSKQDEGIDAINEALLLLEAGDVAESVKAIEKELIEG